LLHWGRTSPVIQKPQQGYDRMGSFSPVVIERGGGSKNLGNCPVRFESVG
jgi:hypothetical protein